MGVGQNKQSSYKKCHHNHRGIFVYLILIMFEIQGKIFPQEESAFFRLFHKQ